MLETWKKPLVYGAIALLAGLMLFWLLRDDPVPVDLHTVTPRPLTVTIDEEGVTRIRDIFRVSAPVSGRVKRSPLKVGDPVRKGKTVVATLEPVITSFHDARARRTLDARAAAADSAVDLAKATVARARADLEFREKDLRRAHRLIQRQTISQRSLDQAVMAEKTSRAALNTAIAELAVRESELESARAQLIEPGTELDAGATSCCVRVLAPVSGRVIRIITESETVVQSGTALVELGNPADLEIVVDLLSVDAVRIREGAKAEIVAWGGAQKLHGVVTRIEPTGFTKVSALGIEEQRVKVLLALEEKFVERHRLGHDYRVYARIIEWQADDVLAVPLSALFRQGQTWSVFVAAGGTAELHTVKIGRKNDVHARIVEGLSAGDQVIIHPNDRIQDGTRITERDAAAPG